MRGCSGLCLKLAYAEPRRELDWTIGGRVSLARDYARLKDYWWAMEDTLLKFA